jgi:Ala-tRNA(Pro) deacylase
MNEVLEFLNRNNIAYKLFEHEAVFTNEESSKINIPEVRNNAKNLFLRNHDKSKYYLISLMHNKRADLKSFAQKIGEKKLSFGSAEDLLSILKLTPGSVSPLGLLNDKDKKVTFYLDKDFLTAPDICIHPNINTGTLVIPIKNFKRVMEILNYQIHEF